MNEQNLTSLLRDRAQDLGDATLYRQLHDSRLAREEVFGPVLAVTTFDTPEEAIRLANDTDYGLAATIHTTDLRTAHLATRAIRAGTVAVNCYGEGDITTPFGGFKQSGFGGRDKSIAAHEQYTELKTIWMDLS